MPAFNPYQQKSFVGMNMNMQMPTMNWGQQGFIGKK
jgi:hypothetical protein